MLLHLALAAVALLVWRVLWRRWKYDVHKIPSPPGLPLLGHTLEFVFGQPTRQIPMWLQTQFSRLGAPKLMKVHVMGDTWLFVTDLDFIKTEMMSKTRAFPRLMKHGGFIVPLAGNDASVKGMSLTEEVTPYVRTVRKMYAAGLRSENLKSAVPKLLAVIRTMVMKIESRRQQGPVDIQELSARMSLDAIGLYAFGKTLGGLDETGKIYHLSRAVGRIARKRTYRPLDTLYCSLFPNSALARAQCGAIDQLTAEWAKLSSCILKKRDPTDGSEPMWFGLKHMKNPQTGQRITFGTLIAEVATLVLGGMDTTGHQLAWILALLATHPRVVSKLLEELRKHGLHGEGAREVEYEDLGELSYLTAVIKEGMRIAHVTPVTLMRQVPRDTTIAGYRVPKGTVIMMPGSRAANTEADYGDTDFFMPEKWLTGEDTSGVYTVGFSMGPRDCIGQRLAMLEMRLALVEIVRLYEFSLEGSYKRLYETSRDGLVTEASNGIHLHFIPRV